MTKEKTQEDGKQGKFMTENKKLKDNCLKLKKEFEFFDNLLLDIRMRKVIFERFEKYLLNIKVDASFSNNNDFCRMICRGYLVQQLLDLEKFFDRDNRVYSFSFLVKHTIENFEEDYEKLFKTWRDDLKLKDIRDKAIAHSQKDYKILLVEKNKLDGFINMTIQLFEKIANDLVENYSISSSYFFDKDDDYLDDVGNDVEIFFKTLNNK